MFAHTTLDMTFRDFTSDHYPIYLILISACIAIIGIVGNFVTCIVIAKNKFMHTATNCYLFSMAVSDLIILFVAYPCYSIIPTVTDFNCQIKILLVKTSVNVMILTVSVLSVERYVAVCHPFLASKQMLSSRSRASKIIFVTWIAGFTCACLMSLQVTCDTELNACLYNDEVGLYSSALGSIFFFFIPMMIMVTMYVRIVKTLRVSAGTVRTSSDFAEHSKQKVPKMLMALVVAFFVCWMPTQFYRILLVYIKVYKVQIEADAVMKYYLYASEFLFYSSSLVNPILYNTMSKKFCEAFKTTLSSCRKTGDTESNEFSKLNDKGTSGDSKTIMKIDNSK